MRTLIINTAFGETKVFNPDKLISIDTSICTIEKDCDPVKVWQIKLDGDWFYVKQSEYSLTNILDALHDANIMVVKRTEESKPGQKPFVIYPDTLTRYDFKFDTCLDKDWGEANDHVMYGDTCYFMYGDLLQATAVIMPQNMAEQLIDNYSFDNPVRNLSWIEVNDHIALLFNDRTK